MASRDHRGSDPSRGFERVLHTLLAINFGAILAVWAPELRSRIPEPTGLVPVHYRFWSELMTLFGVGVFAWAIHDLSAVLRLGRLPKPTPQTHDSGRVARTVLVTGATGFIGSALVRALHQWGDHILALSRDPDRARDKLGRNVEIVKTLASIDPRRPIDAEDEGHARGGSQWFARLRIDLDALRPHLDRHNRPRSSRTRNLHL